VRENFQEFSKILGGRDITLTMLSTSEGPAEDMENTDKVKSNTETKRVEKFLGDFDWMTSPQYEALRAILGRGPAVRKDSRIMKQVCIALSQKPIRDTRGIRYIRLERVATRRWPCYFKWLDNNWSHFEQDFADTWKRTAERMNGGNDAGDPDIFDPLDPEWQKAFDRGLEIWVRENAGSGNPIIDEEELVQKCMDLDEDTILALGRRS
jgi:hypothetical protein